MTQRIETRFYFAGEGLMLIESRVYSNDGHIMLKFDECPSLDLQEKRGAVIDWSLFKRFVSNPKYVWIGKPEYQRCQLSSIVGQYIHFLNSVYELGGEFDYIVPFRELMRLKALLNKIKVINSF